VKRYPLLLLAGGLVLGCSSADEGAADSGPVAETGRLAGMTAAHNAERAQTADGLPALSWDADIAGIAQTHADQLAATSCELVHSKPGEPGAAYGENLAAFASNAPGGPQSAPEDAVASWVGEKSCYTFGSYQQGDACTCDSGCGHYTQIVWRDTQRVGCGVATCDSGDFHKDIWVCNYDPPGNYLGEMPY
jgi:hypothetical protein